MPYQFYNTQTREKPRRETERPYTMDGKPGPMPDGVVELRVIRESPPEVEAGKTLTPTETPNLEAGTITYGWRVVDAPPEPVPDRITPRQLRLWLHRKGLLTDVRGKINTLPEEQKAEAQIEWDYSTEVRRDHPLTLKIIKDLGMTPAQGDQAFREASTF